MVVGRVDTVVSPNRAVTLLRNRRVVSKVRDLEAGRDVDRRVVFLRILSGL